MPPFHLVKGISLSDEGAFQGAEIGCGSFAAIKDELLHCDAWIDAAEVQGVRAGCEVAEERRDAMDAVAYRLSPLCRRDGERGPGSDGDGFCGVDGEAVAQGGAGLKRKRGGEDGFELP